MFSQTVSQYPLQNPSQPAAEQDPLHEVINPQLDIHELFPSKPEHASKLHDLLHPLPQLPNKKKTYSLFLVFGFLKFITLDLLHKDLKHHQLILSYG